LSLQKTFVAVASLSLQKTFVAVASLSLQKTFAADASLSRRASWGRPMSRFTRVARSRVSGQQMFFAESEAAAAPMLVTKALSQDVMVLAFVPLSLIPEESPSFHSNQLIYMTYVLTNVITNFNDEPNRNKLFL
ncbi:hypothetical protein, partial [Lysinibacillus xylanilyticus]|uniref:hypothetical protein n=1 Tax=Lysinibacillus xylanilyticus TaxID=582475 RepID=UPI003D08CE62